MREFRVGVVRGCRELEVLVRGAVGHKRRESALHKRPVESIS